MDTKNSLSEQDQYKVDCIEEAGQHTLKGAANFLKLVHQEFPLDKACMGPGFKGSHSLILTAEGRVQLLLWWQGKGFIIEFK
jgi:hypothetical protein